MSAFTLKLIMFFLMVLDHIYFYIIDTPIWLNYIGRIVAPVYFYLLVESYFHTRNKLKFLGRMSIFAFLNFIILQVMFKQPLNIMLSMALSIGIMYLLDFIRKNKGNFFKGFISIVGIIILIIASLYSEAGYLGVGMTLIFYFLRGKKFLLCVAYAIFSLVEISFVVGSKYFMEELLIGNYQWMMVFSIIPICLYNGKLGYRSKFFNYFFYIAYPLHILILLIIGNTVNHPWYTM